jgi:hypothetical protein
MSPDGRFFWDGSTWVPVAGVAAGAQSADPAEYAARFYLNPTRVGVLTLVAGVPYMFWWLWRLFHHVKHEGLPRPHNFWTILVPLYGLKTTGDQFRSVHEEATRAVGRAGFALQGAFILWLLGLVVDNVAGRLDGVAELVGLLISSAMIAIVGYWVQRAATRYMALRLPGRSTRGMSVGEVIALVIGGIINLGFVAATLFPF